MDSPPNCYTFVYCHNEEPTLECRKQHSPTPSHALPFVERVQMQSYWDRLQEIYASTLALPSAERHEFVAHACAGDSQLLREVSSLLSATESTTGLLESPVVRFSL